MLWLFSASTSAKNTELEEILFHINHHYVDEVNKERLNHEVIATLIEELDPYSEFLTEKKLQQLFDVTNGEYTGLGIEVQERGEHLVIINVLADSPADLAGISKDDVLISINDSRVVDSSLDELSELLQEQDIFTLTVARAGHSERLSYQVARQPIHIQSVSGELNDSNTAYVRINSFNNHSYHDLARQIAILQQRSGHALKGLLIDLRDNPGGTLDSAVAIADLFLHQGLIVSTRGRFSEANQNYYAHTGDILEGAPIVVLINEGSASAAEILAGALKDNNRATLVGTRSYGKGSVQSLIPIGDGRSALKLTTARYFTPSGASIEGRGIIPDVPILQSPLSQSNKEVIIKLTEGKSSERQLTALLDTQLQKAQQLLRP